MPTFLSASKYDALISAGNYFFLRGYDWHVGPYFVQILDEVSLAKKQIDRFNMLLKLLREDWRILPIVVNVEEKPAVFVMRDSGPLLETQKFPHDRLSPLVAAMEQIAQDVANPGGVEDKYLAPDKTGIPTADLLAVAKVSEALIREILPAIALHPSEGVDILVRHPTGKEKTLALPPTEAVRKPVSEPEEPGKPVKPRGLAGIVAGVVPVHGYLVLDDGTFLDLQDSELEEFVVGKTYVFHEVARRFAFSRQVRRVTCEGEQHEMPI